MNGDGRPDIFVAGYTDMADPLTNSIAGFPNNYEGVRDLLFLNEGNGPNGHARFKEVGVEAGLESSHFRHGLGAIFTDVNGDGRPDLYVANDEDPNDLYINEPGGPLGFHFVEEAKAYGIDNRNAGMGVAEGDWNGDGRPDLFITNSRGQPHAAYESEVLKTGETTYVSETAKFAQGARPHGDGRVGRLVRRLRQQRQPRPDHRERCDPRHEPEAGHRTDPGPRRASVAAGSRTRAGSSTSTGCRRSSAEVSQPPTSTTTAAWGSRSTRSAARSSCSRTRARSATGSRSR